MRKRADASKYLIAAVAVALFAAAAVSQAAPPSTQTSQQSAAQASPPASTETQASQADTATPATTSAASASPSETTETSAVRSQGVAREADRAPTPAQRSPAPTAREQAPRCAHLTGIPKAECERRDTDTDDLPAGVTPAQRERQALRDESVTSDDDTK